MSELRFGVNLFSSGSRKVWQDTARRAEDLGYDVLLAPDHLGMIAPFPALVSAAEVTTRPRLGTLVLNAGFYKPALLAREAAALHELTDGRFELGLGTGYAAEEFAAAELPFPSMRQRVEHLDHTLTEVNRLLDAAGQRVPVLIGGKSDRVLTIAAQHATIVNLAGKDPKFGHPDPLAERIEFLRSAAGDRFAELELALVVPTVQLAGSGELNLTIPRRLHPGLSDEELRRLPGILYGSEQEIADTLRGLRETYGITYFITLERGKNMESLGKVISQLS